MQYLSVTLTLVATLCLFGLGAEGESSARLLASKTILNELLVEGKELTVEYNIFNIGDSAAVSVELDDQSFLEAHFERVSGYLNVKWPRLAPNSNVSHVVILRPVRAGYFNFTSATVSYLPSEDAREKQVGYTSAPGEGQIYNFKDYDRKFSPHVLDWAAFAVMTLPSLGIPFLLWYRSKAKYDSLKAAKKGN